MICSRITEQSLCIFKPLLLTYDNHSQTECSSLCLDPALPLFKAENLLVDRLLALRAISSSIVAHFLDFNSSIIPIHRIGC